MNTKFEMMVPTNEGPKKVRAQTVRLVPWLKTVIHRALDNDSLYGRWIVAEFTTGYRIASQHYQKNAKHDAKSKLIEAGEDKTLALLWRAERLNK